MSPVVIYNPHSGKKDVLEDIKQAFRTAGATPTYVPITEIDQALPPLVEQPGRTIVAAGGDGTVNSVARHLLGSKARLAVIPVGTLNHFARELNIPLDIAGAVKTALGDSLIEVDVGTVNNQVFVNNSSIGWYPRSLRAREELSDRLGKWPAAVVGSLKAAVRPRRYHVELTVNGQQFTYYTPFVFIANNAYKRADPGIGQRETLQGGMLAIYIVKAQSLAGILRMLAVGLFTRERRTQDFAVYHAANCTIHTRHHHQLNVACDGEVTSLPTPLAYHCKAASLRLLVP